MIARVLVAAIVLALLPLVPGLGTNFGLSLLSQMGIAAVFALSYNLLLGQTGLLSFGHAVYFGFGAYAAIHAMRAIDAGFYFPVVLLPLVGAAAGLAFGALFGAVTTRRAGIVFALISLGVGELVFAASRMLQGWSGGEEGISANRTKGPHWLGIHLGSQLEVYYVIAFFTLVAALLMYAFTRTPVGRLCNAVRDNPERVEFIGYSAQRIRFIVFSVAATFAGLAGGLHAINYEIVAADAFGALRSGAVLLMVYIGGQSSFIGPVIGALVLTWLQVSLSDYTPAWQLYVGLFFMAVVVFAPDGLAGLFAMHRPIVRTRAFRGVVKAYSLALPPFLLMALGVILLVEINYRLSTRYEAASRLRFFGFDIDIARPWPWICAFLLAAIGYWLFRRAGPKVASAWARAEEEAGTQRPVVAR
jgi:branched-chain amino acid transport system permease protein